MCIRDSIALMRKGEIVQTGTAEDLYFCPESLFAARFFCDLNEIEALAFNGRISTPIGDFAAPPGLPDGQVTLCLRPFGVTLEAPSNLPTGALVQRRFLGDEDLFQVAVEGLAAPLRVRGRADPALTAGVRVGLRIDPQHVLVFGRNSV